MSSPLLRALLVVFLSAAVLVGCGEDDKKPKDEPTVLTLRLATLNLRNKENWWEDRFPLIADGVAENKPDLMGVQEVSQPFDQLNVLLGLVNDRDASLMYNTEFTPAPEPFLTLTGEGIGLLSRFTVEKYKELYLSDGRLCIFARIDLGDGHRLDFYNTHLHALAGANEDDIRTKQTADIVEFIGKNEAGYPTLVTGDFNSVDTSDAYKNMVDAGFIDTYRAVHGDDTEPGGFTSSVKLAREPVEIMPKRRIDFIFVRDGGATGPAESDGGETDGGDVPGSGTFELKDSRVAWNKPAEDGLYPSDHLGVITDVTLTFR